MKKLIFTFLAALLAHITFAQTGIGGSIGASFSQSSTNYASTGEKARPIVSIPFSFLLEFPLKKNLSILTGLSYLKKGVSFREKNHGDYYQMGLHLSFLEVPATLKIQLGKGKSKFYLLEGLYAGYLLSGKIKSKEKVNGEVVKSSSTMNLADFGLNTHLDLGIITGAGISFTRKHGYFFVSPSIHFGLQNLDTDTDSFLKTRAIIFSMGYIYSLPNKAKK